MNCTFFPKTIDTDLLLIFPPFQRPIVSMENIGIEYIAASARANGFRSSIINAGLHGLGVDDIVEILRCSRFLLLGISTIHWTLHAAVKIAKAARELHPDCHIIFGGVEAALDAKRILLDYPFVDSIGMGEGEQMVSSLLSALAGGKDWRKLDGLAYRSGRSVHYTQSLRLIDPLDELPFPARDDMAAVIDSGGAVSMSSSRGCPGRCSFCSVRAFYGLSEGRSWRGRSPLSVVTEMQELQGKYGARLFSFIDETVVGPGENGRARLRELASLIKQSGLKADLFMTVRADQVERDLFRELKSAGLRKVEIGIESMAPSQLRRYGKRACVEDNRSALVILEELGIASELFMVPFDPGVTAAEMEMNLCFYRERYDRSTVYDVSPLSLGNYLFPYPGTGTRVVYEQNGWLNGGSHAVFHAMDRRMQKVGDVLIWLVGSSFEPIFPMSYMGLGNLWINGAGLPENVYERIGGICGEIGILLVDTANWTLSVTAKPLPIPIHDVEKLITELRRFLARARALRKEVCAITNAYGRKNEAGLMFKSEQPFADELYSLGRERKQRILDKSQDAEIDEHDIITRILDILTKESA